MFKGKRAKVVECYNDGTFKGRRKGTPYWTVVNNEHGYHRHYDAKSTAMAVARKVNTLCIPKHYGSALKRDILYLMTGINQTKEGTE